MSDRRQALEAAVRRSRRAIEAWSAPGIERTRRVTARVRSTSGWPAVRGAVVVVAIAAGVVVAAVVSGSMDSSNATLRFMGFDADRAQMITALMIAGAAAAVATLITNRSGQSTLAGLGSLAALFGPTFLVETHNALAPSDVIGTFSLTGWVLTVIALAMSGLISSWAGSALAGVLRPGLIEAGTVVRDAVRSRRLSRSLLRRPLAVAVVAILVAMSVPVFGDMVNYKPDAPMLHGGAPPVGLIPAELSNLPTPVRRPPSPAPSAAETVSGSSIQPTPSAQPSRTAPANRRPWLDWRPSGNGAITWIELPAPWTDSPMKTNSLSVYTPPGYDPNGGRRYPVLYEAPYEVGLWDKSMNFTVVMDNLIDTGAIPPMLVVFVNTWQAPIDDTECANSADGRQWVDTYLSDTVVAYMDTHFLTIARREARAFTGFSQGGYCAAIVPLKHPTVFGTGIPISGYYHVGGGGPNSLLPFAGNPYALAAASPVDFARTLSQAQREMLFFIVVADLSQPFFGAEAQDLLRVLDTEGYEYLAIDSKIGHGWEQVRHELPVALAAWASHMVDSGVF